MANPVRVETSGPVTTIILARPERRNAIDREMAEALADAFRAFEQDETARAAVLFGEGGTFSAGADLKAVAEGKGNRVEPGGDGPLGPTRMRLTKPVLAAVAGHAVAGGLELALWCDLRVVEEDAVPLIDGGTVRLPRLIGLSRALDLILTGRAVSAREALEMGLANRLVPKGSARPSAEALALTLARLPQACLRSDRLSALEGQDLPFAQALENELQRGLASLSQEGLEGAARFRAGAGRHGAPE
jgi:enoyl-CoA hydratase